MGLPIWQPHFFLHTAKPLAKGYDSMARRVEYLGGCGRVGLPRARTDVASKCLKIIYYEQILGKIATPV